jgi:hypothetical protein
MTAMAIRGRTGCPGRRFEGAAIVVYGRLRSIFLITPRKFGI